MYCQKCETHTDGKYCPNCGAPAQEEKAEATLNGQPFNSAPLKQSKKQKKKLPTWGKIGIVLLVFMLLVWAISESISDAVFAAGLIGTIIYLVSLIVSTIKKRSIKTNLLCLAVSFALIIIGAAAPTDTYKKLDKYDWGNSLEIILKEIGVEKINKISIDEKDESLYKGYDAMPIIQTEKGSLDVWVSYRESDQKWEVLSVRDKEDYKKIYYLDDAEEDIKSGSLANDIYSYQTGEIIHKANPEAKAKREKELQEFQLEQQEEHKESQDKKLKEAQSLPQLIINAYNNNAVKAKEEYVGKTHTIAGTVVSINDGVLPATTDVEINCNGVSVICTFKGTEREKIIEKSKGDEIVVTGRCDGIAILRDLTFNSCVLDEI